MAYRYQWVWQWSATRHLPTAGMTEELLAHIESQIREKLLSQPQITGLESITHSGVSFWTTNLGMTGNWSGTTTTVFVSTEPSESPIAPVIVAIIALVVAGIIAAFIYFILTSISSIVEKAPVAVAAGAFALLGLVLIGGYMMIKPKKEG